MSFPRYPSYKDSGVEWLGQVPEHWEVIRLKNVLQRRITDGPHTTPVFTTEGVPFLSVDGIQDGELRFDGCRYISEADHAEYRVKALPQRDDLLMGKAASTGKIARVKVDFEFSIWSPLALIRLNPAVSNPIFFEQCLKSPIVQAQIDNFCTSNTQKNISMDDIPRLVLTRPPLEEQRLIAEFLDRETGKIDELVVEQRRLMELLKEKRQAVISHAVTRGLNPAAPLKPSGIDWLGDIPEHWKPIRLRFACSTIFLGLTTKVDYVEEGGVPLVRALNILGGVLDLSDVRFISEEQHKGLTKRNLAKRDDVLLSKSGSIGTAAIVDSDIEFSIYESIFVLRAREGVLTPKYLLQLLRSPSCSAQYSASLVGMGVGHLNMSDIVDVRVALPPLAEQSSIVEHLESEIEKFDTLTAEAQRAIDLLQERRTALISAAVTGQIDVRSAVAAS